MQQGYQIKGPNGSTRESTLHHRHSVGYES